jgi:hypothetical protein
MRHLLVVVGKEGTRIRFDSHFRHAEQAVGFVIDELHRRSPTVRASRRSRSRPRVFGTRAKASCPGRSSRPSMSMGRIPPRLNVLAHGKSFPWAAERMPRVHNALLLLERLTERGST